MSLYADETFFGSDFVEIPCEFCGELYPLELLMDHQSGCRAELLSAAAALDAVSSVKAADASSAMSAAASSAMAAASSDSSISFIIPKAAASVRTVQIEQTPNLPNLQSSAASTSKTSPVKQSKEGSISKVINAIDELLIDDDEDDISLEHEDLSSQETETKLMSFGCAVAKRTEEDKPTFRSPILPLVSKDDGKEMEDTFKSLSDDDEDDTECLEDFWKRAAVKIDQRLSQLRRTVI
ncbi:hypothetical protein CEXT_91801 [Caerostris extrusa]|uniref:Uncharacterized protein n=1 Tax=Caerostris extrusa TaxID=172846 RepID=A0AAV4Q5Y0_CAEEX|nr:hypothetical protein CEXT_91801 [Caerostris extrusa]